MAATENKEKKVRIRIPLTRENQGDVFVRVNRRTFLIKRGETVEVPECVAEVIRHSEEMEIEGLKYQQKVTKG